VSVRDRILRMLVSMLVFVSVLMGVNVVVPALAIWCNYELVSRGQKSPAALKREHFIGHPGQWSPYILGLSITGFVRRPVWGKGG